MTTDRYAQEQQASIQEATSSKINMARHLSWTLLIFAGQQVLVSVCALLDDSSIILIEGSCCPSQLTNHKFLLFYRKLANLTPISKQEGKRRRRTYLVIAGIVFVFT